METGGRSKKKAKFKAEFVTQKRSMSWPKLLFGMLAVLVLGAIGYSTIKNDWRHDPNYLEAKAQIGEYEYGKLDSEKNYSHESYKTAITLLSRVDPDSVSAEPAKALSDDIKDKQARFVKALQARRDSQEQDRQKKLKRKADLAKIQRRDQLNPQTVFPECDENDE